MAGDDEIPFFLLGRLLSIGDYGSVIDLLRLPLLFLPSFADSAFQDSVHWDYCFF